MTRQPSLSTLRVEEREAHARVSTFRARLYSRPPADLIGAQRRLAELERRWEGAQQRLHEAQQEAARETAQPKETAQPT